MWNPATEFEQLAAWAEAIFDRASGPGGQNVNKVNTRVALLLDFERCPLFSDAQKNAIRARLARRLAADGRLRVVAQSERSQLANRNAAQARLLELLASAVHQAAPRRPSRPTAASRRRRLTAKRRRSAVKRDRGGNFASDAD